jgi:hypothetical protein
LALLRAHGLIRKVSGTHRYQITERGRRIITALLSARNADVDQHSTCRLRILSKMKGFYRLQCKGNL